MDLLVDEVQYATDRKIEALRPPERIRSAKGREQGARLDVGITRRLVEIGLGPGIGGLSVDNQPFRSGAEAVAAPEGYAAL